MRNSVSNARKRRKKVANRNPGLFYRTALSVIFLDRLSKYLVLHFLSGGAPPLKIFRYFSLTLVKNRGICFGMLTGINLRIAIIIASFLIGIMIILYLLRSGEKSKRTEMALGFIEGGIAGNLIDRIATGAVIDFLDFHFWPVFNLADVSIVSGITLILLEHMAKKKHAPSSVPVNSGKELCPSETECGGRG